MTDQPIEQEPVGVIPPADSKLAQLHALYPEAKAKADAAAEELKAITDGIKAELAQAAPGSLRVDLAGDPESGLPGLRLAHSRRATFDSTRFKKAHPETYVAYAKFSDSWSLREVKA